MAERSLQGSENTFAHGLLSKSGHTIVSLASVQFVHNRISKIISQYARKTAFKKRVCLDNIKGKIFEGYA